MSMKFSFCAAVAVAFLCCLTVIPRSNAAPRVPSAAALNENSREIFDTSMQWADRAFDSRVKLCRTPDSLPNRELPTAPYFMVRESTWYALGLLLRDKPGDRARAVDILRVVLDQQYHEPGKPWDGTFRRSPNDPEPGPDAVIWRGYDPNWREFIGTTFAVILEEYRDRIPGDLAGRMLSSIDDAVAGEIKQGRLAPTYTNPALMFGFLWEYAAVRGNRPDWVAPAEKWQQTVYGLYKQHDAFYEFNSPTYAGVDFFALALWRDYAITPRMRKMGEEMEAGLWRTIARLYNANLRNISGPYDRSYGMDMRSYVSVTGLWLRTVLSAAKAPLTAFNPPVDHVADLWFVPPIVVLGTRIPPDAMKSFVSFPGEHEVRQPIAGSRVATAWIGREVVYGGEITGHTRGVDAQSQFHPVTVQWQAPGKIGWVQLTSCPSVDADATKGGIVITTSGDISFRMSAPGLRSGEVKADEWRLPGLSIKVKADVKRFNVAQQGAFVDVTYTGITHMTLTIAASGR